MAGVSFDRAADYYDATRALPDQVRESLADILAAELLGRGPCLEIGVGTGRIALPLHQRGIDLLGADIARAMLERLATNAGGRSPFPLILADATRLPLSGSSVGAVIASHVFHLIPDWRDAVDEAMRVLRPGGLLLVDFGGGRPAPWSGACQERLRIQGISQDRPGIFAVEDLSEYLGGRTQMRPLRPVRMTFRRSLGQDLNDWEHQLQAWTWPYSAEQMRIACGDVRDWAIDQGWLLDQQVELETTIQWWALG